MLAKNIFTVSDCALFHVNMKDILLHNAKKASRRGITWTVEFRVVTLRSILWFILPHAWTNFILSFCLSSSISLSPVTAHGVTDQYRLRELYRLCYKFSYR